MKFNEIQSSPVITGRAAKRIKKLLRIKPTKETELGKKILEEMFKERERSMNIFDCKHNWEITERSNVLQQDEMGYPLRLFVCKCSKCGKSEQQWIDVNEKELEDLEAGKSVLLKWNEI